MKLITMLGLTAAAFTFNLNAEDAPTAPTTPPATAPAATKISAPKPKSTKVEFTDIGEVEFEAPEQDQVIRYTLDGSEPKADSYGYCVPVRASKSLKLRAATFNKEGKSSEISEVEFVLKPGGEKPEKLTVAINLDFSDAPEMKEWALKARKFAEEYYPKIQELLPIDGYTPPRQVMFLWKDVKGVAFTTGTKCTFAVKFYKSNPNDFGSVIHELTHVYQQYKGRGNPGWLVEGIADYIRWHNWEPVEKRRKFNPKSAKLANAYNDSATFLVYLQNTYDKELCKKLNEACHKGTYNEEMIKSICKKDVTGLWDEFVASYNKPAPASETKATTENKPTETKSTEPKAVAEKAPDTKAPETK